ncbi:MAG TPA: Gfo/Idh/MocA family oxidoreductase [Firmicutes bacterium]|nr:Gfo/Idh/MocA family oxidoreductase [Bacillota bacterium]
MKKPIRFGLIGFGGYGKAHCRALAYQSAQGQAVLAAVAEVNQAPYVDELQKLKAEGVGIYTDWRKMLDDGHIDAVAIAAPMHLHREMATTAMEKGYPVLCEKPAAAVVQDVITMAEAAGRTGLPCAIDYQLLVSRVIKKLTALIREGRLGELRRIAGVGLWKRTDAYYSRAGWAGKFKPGGNYALDGPMDNALSHMLNNMMYLAGVPAGDKAGSGVGDGDDEVWNKLATPLEVRAEMYRAQPLPEMEDTATVQVKTAEGVELFYFATYCNHVSEPHFYRLEGTKATAVVRGPNITLIPAAGSGGAPGAPEEPLQINAQETDKNNSDTTAVYSQFIAVLEGRAKGVSAPVEESVKLVRVQNGAYYSSGAIHPIPPEWVERVAEKDTMATRISDLGKVFHSGAESGKLPSDLPAPWAKKTNWVSVEKLIHYAPEAPDRLNTGAVWE